MNKLKELLSKFLPNAPYDKKLHFLCGFLISVIMGLVIGAGIAKECYDDWNCWMWVP